MQEQRHDFFLLPAAPFQSIEPRLNSEYSEGPAARLGRRVQAHVGRITDRMAIASLVQAINGGADVDGRLPYFQPDIGRRDHEGISSS